MNKPVPEYVGFWARVGAAIIDSILMAIVLVPIARILGIGYDWDELDSPANIVMNGVLPAIVVILFWVYRQATPGKMVIGAKIVDAKTRRQAVDRPVHRPLPLVLPLVDRVCARLHLGRLRRPEAGLA